MRKQLITFFMLLILSAVSLAETTDAVDPLALLAEVRKDLDGLQAQFYQFEVTEDNRQVDSNYGTVWMQAPDKFRWHYQDPIEQLIVADGDQVWVYDEDLEQVTVKPQNNQLNPIYVIINDELSQQHYDIKYEASSQNISWVSLTPKQSSEEVKTVWLGIKADDIKTIKVVNHFGQTMVFEFNEIQRNPKFAIGLFEFEPPEGVDVVQAISE